VLAGRSAVVTALQVAIIKWDAYKPPERSADELEASVKGWGRESVGTG
jgi:hypothetical protein